MVPNVSTPITEEPNRASAKSVESECQSDSRWSAKEYDGLTVISDKIGILGETGEPKIKQPTVAHAENVGQRRGEGTAAILGEERECVGLTDDTNDFAASYVLCVLSRKGFIIP